MSGAKWKNAPRRAHRSLLVVAASIALPALALAGPLWQVGPSISPPSVLAGDGKSDSVSPSASGNVMVYSDCSSGKCNISMVNLTTRQITPITKAGYNQLNPATDGALLSGRIAAIRPIPTPPTTPTTSTCTPLT